MTAVYSKYNFNIKTCIKAFFLAILRTFTYAMNNYNRYYLIELFYDFNTKIRTFKKGRPKLDLHVNMGTPFTDIYHLYKTFQQHDIFKPLSVSHSLAKAKFTSFKLLHPQTKDAISPSHNN